MRFRDSSSLVVLQLGAALAAAGDDPAGRAFVCLDDRLAAAARAEGFTILP